MICETEQNTDTYLRRYRLLELQPTVRKKVINGLRYQFLITSLWLNIGILEDSIIAARFGPLTSSPGGYTGPCRKEDG